MTPSPSLPPQWRPLRTGNPAIDEALRIAFNHIYSLQAMNADLQNRVQAIEKASST
jgi:hypothetical protein